MIDWIVNEVLTRIGVTIGLVPLAAMAAIGMHWARKRFMPPRTDQMSFLYAFFDASDCPAGVSRLILSTQLHLASCRDAFSQYNLTLLREYEKAAAPGTVLRLSDMHSQDLIGNAANLLWAQACSQGQLARSRGLPTEAWQVMVAFIASPTSGVTSKHRVLVVSIDVLQNLPKLAQVLPACGMTQAKLEDWMMALSHMAIVLREEGSESPRSARVNQMVIRC